MSIVIKTLIVVTRVVLMVCLSTVLDTLSQTTKPHPQIGLSPNLPLRNDTNETLSHS